jgi:hypothetical protein
MKNLTDFQKKIVKQFMPRVPALDYDRYSVPKSRKLVISPKSKLTVKKNVTKLGETKIKLSNGKELCARTLENPYDFFLATSPKISNYK